MSERIANLFTRPIGSTGREPIIGFDEAGNPMRRSALGVQYLTKPKTDQKALQRKRTADALLKAAQSGKPFDPALHQAKQDIGSPLDAAFGLVGAAAEGVTAPGRALAGEPVTYGDAWNTALDYGGVANLGKAPAGALRGGSMRSDKGIRAYHGSPHDFDKFSMDKIGTGEGAQAYGHGLYFAESEDVARNYRSALAQGMGDGNLRTAGVSDNDLRAMRQFTQSAVDAETALKDWLHWVGKEETPEIRDAFMRDWSGRNDGRLYEVSINANPDDFLDWDKPLSEQPQSVREGLAALDPDMYAPDGNDFDPMETGQMIYSRLQNDARGYGIDSGNVDFTTLPGSQGKASNDLHGFGIPGIKYLDAGSRGAGDGSRNYVVFDENLIEIVRKYGIAGAAAMLGVSVQDVEAAVAQ